MSKENCIADMLSRWENFPQQKIKLATILPDHKWVRVPESGFDVNTEVQFYFSAGLPHKCKALASRMNSRIKFAYAPKTWKSYQKMFLTFLTFCTFLRLDVKLVEVVHIKLFMEFLYQNNLSVNVIRNYIAGIVMYHKWFGLQVEKFYDYQVTQMFRAFERSTQKKPKFKQIFLVQDVIEIVKACSRYSYPQIFKTIYIFAYLGFLRISNMVPSSVSKFDINRNLCRGDIMIKNDKVIVILKWSKTLQSPHQGVTTTR